MQEIIEKVTIFTTKPVVGQYRFKDRLQIYPSKRKPVRNGRLFYSLTIEIVFPQRGENYFRFGIPIGTDQLSKQIIEVHHLLSVVTQFFFFDYIKSTRTIKTFSNRTYEPIEIGNIRWYQDKVLDDRNVNNFVIPAYMDKILEAYYTLPNDILITFRRACYLFYCGVELRGTKPSLSFAAFISAIETLMSVGKKSPENCNTCGQPIYRLSSSFRDFIIEFGYGGHESSVAKKFINRLYSTRSQILHSGQLLLADMFWHSVEEDNKGPAWEESFLHKDLLGVTRVCLINWVAANRSS